MKERVSLGILKQIESDHELNEAWEKLSPESQEYFQRVDEGELVPNLLSDSIFKTIFDPEVSPERISRLVSSILGRDVSVVRSMDKEGIYLSSQSKGVILDLVVEFSDGSVADVEIQREGARIPSQRSAAYSANLLTRQFSVERGESKADLVYTKLRPVYTIIIMEDSPEPFTLSSECVHHFCQKSDTGVENGTKLEFLQYYDYVCLDVFRTKHPHVASMLEVWLEFFTIRRADEMKQFLSENAGFQEIYDQAIKMLAGRRELLNMIQDIFANEDIKKTIYYTMKDDMDRMIRAKDEVIKAKDDQLQEMQSEIIELKEYIKKLESAKN